MTSELNKLQLEQRSSEDAVRAKTTELRKIQVSEVPPTNLLINQPTRAFVLPFPSKVPRHSGQHFSLQVRRKRINMFWYVRNSAKRDEDDQIEASLCLISLIHSSIPAEI